MTEESRSVRVRIFGSEYSIRGEAEAEYIRELARYVDGKMQEVARGTSLNVPLKVSILAAINLADEVFRLRAAKTEAERAVAAHATPPTQLPLTPPEPAQETILAAEAVAALAAHIEEALKEE
jgi:cell division protein ZapA